MARLLQKMARLRRDIAGATMIEFALILPVLLMAILGTWQVSYIAWAQHRLENAVREGSRVGITGQSGGPTSTRKEIIETAIRESASSIVKVDGVDMKIVGCASPSFATFVKPGELYDDTNRNGACDNGEVYYDYSGDGAYSPDYVCTPGSGNAGDAVKYDVSFPVDLFVPLVNMFFSADNRLDLKAQTMVRNESFGVTAPAPSLICP
jgi:Flp pilus assembly protein TadG